MINVKSIHNIWLRPIAITVTCLFIISDLTFAADSLAPESRMNSETFHKQFKLGYDILAHEAANKYIEKFIISVVNGTKIENIDAKAIADFEQYCKEHGNIDITASWYNFRTTTRMVGGQKVILVSVPGLLKNIGQAGHVGLGRQNGKPVAYLDSTLFYDERAIMALAQELKAAGAEGEVSDIVKLLETAGVHELEEIDKYEARRHAFESDYQELRGWVDTHRAEAEGFHESTASKDRLEALYKLITGHPQKFGLNLDNLSEIYANYRTYGFDRESPATFNIAAKATTQYKTYGPTIQVYRDKDRLGENVGEDIAEVIKDAIEKRGHAVLVMPTGSTPVPVYDELVAEAWYGELDLTKVTIFMMDEYEGGIDYATFIVGNFLKKLPPNNRPAEVNVLKGTRLSYPYIDSMVHRRTITEYDNRIDELGGIDLVLGGIGVEGHIAFNEKGSKPTDKTREIMLSASTIIANEDARLKGYTKAMTIGLANILKARKIIIVATGPKKGWAISKALGTDLSKSDPGDIIPGAWLKTHHDVTFAVDLDTKRAMDFFDSEKVIKFADPNIRTGKEGYGWGTWFGASRIFARIFKSSNKYAYEAFRDKAGKKPGVYEATSEFWIASDDERYPSIIDIGGPRLTAMRDWLESRGIYLLRLKVKDIPGVGWLTRRLPQSKFRTRLRNIKVFAGLEKFLNEKNVYVLRRPPASFRDILEAYPEEMLGKRHIEEYGPFIATVMKVLDAKETLSVGVHPRADNKLGLPGRPELWKFLDTSEAWFGFNEDMTDQDIIDAVPKPYLYWDQLTGSQRSIFGYRAKLTGSDRRLPVSFDMMTREQRRRFYNEEWDEFLLLPGHLTERLNRARFEVNTLASVPGGVIHALRGGTLVSEWSRAPSSKEMKDPLSDASDLTLSSIGTEDRGDMDFPKKARGTAVQKQDGDLEFILKEDVGRTIDVLDDAKRPGFDPYKRLNPDNYKFSALKLGEFDNGRITIETLFQTPEIVVEEMRFRPGATQALSIEEFQGRGYPIFMEKGTVSIYDANGKKLGTLREFQPGFIPAYLASKIYIKAEGDGEVVMQRWFAPFPDERELIEADGGKRTADLSASRVYSAGMPGDVTRREAAVAAAEPAAKPAASARAGPVYRAGFYAAVEEPMAYPGDGLAEDALELSGEPQTDASPTNFLETMQRNPEFMTGALGENGFMVYDPQETFSAYSWRNADYGKFGIGDISLVMVENEVDLLISLGILIEVKGKRRYKFSNMMKGPIPNPAYTATLINVIRDIRFSINGADKKLAEIEVNSSNAAMMRAVIELAITNYLHTQAIGRTRAIEEPRTVRIWGGYAAPSQQSLMTAIEKMTREKPFQVDFEKDMKKLVDEACANVNDNIVTIIPIDESFLTPILRQRLTDANAKVMYVDLWQKFGALDLAPLEGLIAIGRAYLNDDEESFYRLYELLAKPDTYEHIALANLKNNPILFINRLKFMLKPIMAQNTEDLARINNRMEALLVSA